MLNSLVFREEKIKSNNKSFELYEVNDTSFLRLLQSKFKCHSQKNALSIKGKDGWKSMSYMELLRLADNFSRHLIESGLEREDRVAILSESMPQWSVALFGIIMAGGTTVPLDIKLTRSELVSILSDCTPEVLCVSNKFMDTAEYLKQVIPSIKKIYSLEDEGGTRAECITEVTYHKRTFIKNRYPDETAFIVYTSGTTGNPKGVMISFRNLLTQLKDYEEIFKITPNDSLLSVLPLNHLLELNAGLIEMLIRGANINYTDSLTPSDITRILKDRHINYMIVVPSFIKMLKLSIEKGIRKSSNSKQKLFSILYKLAKFLPISIRRVIFTGLRRNFGENLKGFISGGAPLDGSIAEFFDRIGIVVYQGYGLTETSPTVSTNTPEHNRIGSVGKPLPSVKVKIADNGEILISGNSVMKGYYNNNHKTKEAIDEEGWLHTGDIGKLDQDGYLYITGRIKNMIVLSSGKKVMPEEVESVLEKSLKIRELCVFGSEIQKGSKTGYEEVRVAVVPHEDLKRKYNFDSERLKTDLTNEINELSKKLANFKRPTSIDIHLDPLPKTTTNKIRRELLKEIHKC